ncbi:hypothetical protein ACFOZ0_15685 [Streptomyces yaanensis]|uniref:Uncharacterized protein n=1 Tax=Streptomyces yaanensis TaxID=1142239 RepID=A0ABV7SHA8_9ACTN|nr:hypothetical protein [Streptomyces sp. CGMCC 4.7035]WNB98490.1 hypothetical protein Q2K21_10615 [Streptomyces sp. CGMCC 4.7035]
MGDRESDGRTFVRRRTPPGSRVHITDGEGEGAATESLLARALLDHPVTAEAEQRATAAFRAARDAGLHDGARTRRRDDWRPNDRARARRSVKATIAVFVASLTLGGVAVAAMGSYGPADDANDDSRTRAHPSPSAPEGSAAESARTRPGAPRTSTAADRPLTAKDIEAHCRAYESVRNQGKALEATAWQRLIAAAGGEEKVAVYCADQLARTEAAETAKPGKAGEAGKAGQAGEPGEKNKADRATKEPGEPAANATSKNK